MDLTSFIKIELVIATNFDFVWKDTISTLGQNQYCYGYMGAYEHVLQSFTFRDLMSLCGLSIAFIWMSSVVKVFFEFSSGADLPSRLVNDAGSASFTTAFTILALVLLRMAFDIVWVSSNVAVFWVHVLTDSTNPFTSLGHMGCLPAIGKSQPTVRVTFFARNANHCRIIRSHSFRNGYFILVQCKHVFGSRLSCKALTRAIFSISCGKRKS
jgi:hypothetical protein